MDTEGSEFSQCIGIRVSQILGREKTIYSDMGYLGLERGKQLAKGLAVCWSFHLICND